jgi:hypothetical protein
MRRIFFLFFFFINNQPIEIVESFTHLGHRITSLMEDDDDIINRRSDFTGQVNNMLCYFKALDPSVRFKLFTSYCTSLYGCELWSLTNRRIEDLCVAWRKSLRAVWRLPQCTHKYLLHSISHCLPVFDEICRRSLNFIKSCITHHSQLIRFISLHSVLFVLSWFFHRRPKYYVLHPQISMFCTGYSARFC